MKVGLGYTYARDARNRLSEYHSGPINSNHRRTERRRPTRPPQTHPDTLHALRIHISRVQMKNRCHFVQPTHLQDQTPSRRWSPENHMHLLLICVWVSHIAGWPGLSICLFPTSLTPCFPQNLSRPIAPGKIFCSSMRQNAHSIPKPARRPVARSGLDHDGLSW